MLKIRLIIIFQMAICSLVNAGEWINVDSRTLSFSGIILEGEFERFSQFYNSNIERIIVNSPGGSTLEALEIGMRIHRDGVNIEVNEKCISSCALYFFLPAKSKRLEKGFVGFHGSVGVSEELYPEDFYNPSEQDLLLINSPKEEAVKNWWLISPPKECFSRK